MWRLVQRLRVGTRLTDEDYVQRVRKAVAFWERWRRALLIMNTILMMAFIVVVLFAADVLRILMQWNQGQGVFPGFVVGALIGLMLAFALDHVIHGLVNAQRSWRTEQLLLRYHDALAVLAQEHADTESANA